MPQTPAAQATAAGARRTPRSRVHGAPLRAVPEALADLALSGEPGEPATDGVRPSRAWTRAVVRALRELGLLAVLINGAFNTVLLPQQQAATHPVFRLGLAVLYAHLLGMTLALWRGWRRPAVLDGLTVMMFVALALMSPYRDQLDPGDLWAPGMYAIPMQVLLLMRLPPRAYVRRAVPALLALVGVELLGMASWPVTPSRLADSVMVLEPIGTLQVFASGLFAMASRHDRDETKAAAARAGQAAQAAETEGRREAARLMHDHVLHSLHAVAEDRELVTAGQAVVECRDTIERLDRPSPEARLVDVTGLIGADPALAHAGATLEGRSELLPNAVAQAMAAATHEALTNVAVHARATRCRVEVTSVDDEGCRIRVVDDGRGFDTSAPARGRLGLQRSVRERMHDVGGRTVLTSRPGHGTTVELQWPAPDTVADAEESPVWATPFARFFLSVAALPGLACGLVVMALMAPRTAAGLPGVLLTCLMTAVATWHVVRSASRPMTSRAAVGLLALCAAAWVADLCATPHRTPDVYDLYVAWGATASVQLVIPNLDRHRARRLCRAWLAVLLAGALWRYTPAQVVFRLNGAVIAGLVIIIGYRAMWIAQDMAAHSEAQREQAQALHLDLVRMHTLARLDQFWSQRVTDEALPLLRGVADGELDPARDDVRQRARSTEALVRDELVLGPGQAAFSEDLHRLRQDGWVVSSSLSRDDGAAALGAARRLVEALGPATATGQHVTLSATAGGVSAVVLDAGPAQLDTWTTLIPTLGGTVYTDPDFTRLAVEVR